MFEIRETIDGKQFSLVFPTGPNDIFSLEATNLITHEPNVKYIYFFEL